MPDEVIVEHPGFKLEWGTTDRGFGRAEFTDVYGNECSIQESSSVLPRLWLGVHKPGRGMMPSSMSASEYDLVCNGSRRMHLSKSQATALARAILVWAEREDDPIITSDD